MELDSQNELAAPEPLLAQANLERIRGHWAEAVDICVRVLRSSPGNADAHSLLGDIYRDQGALDDAIQWYRMAADLRPTGPDVEKLRKLEIERERRQARSGPLAAAIAAGAYESGAGGTTQLMGHSPKRWLNTLTIVSVSFLAATIIVLTLVRLNQPDHFGAHSSTTFGSRETSSHPAMPTAETGVKLPRISPNAAPVLPMGEQPRAVQKPHVTGEGLEPDRPSSSRTTPLPNFAPQPQTGAKAAPPATPQSREIPPAPVQLVRPLAPTISDADGSPARTEPSALNTPSQPKILGVSGQVEERDPNAEREPIPETGSVKPASQNNAGEKVTDGGPPPQAP